MTALYLFTNSRIVAERNKKIGFHMAPCTLKRLNRIAATSVCYVILFATSQVLAESWKELREGLAEATFRFPTNQGAEAEIFAVRIDPTFFDVRVIDVYGSLTNNLATSPPFDINAVIGVTNPEVIINGGYSGSFALPIASGLVIDDGRLITRLNTTSPVQSGIFCVTREKTITIIHPKQFQLGTCIQAVQAGPVLVEYRGTIGIYKEERERKKRARRSFAALCQERLILGTTSEMHLYDLASFLARNETEGGLACVVALNLDGSSQAGLYVRVDNIGHSFGNLEAEVPSAIAVFRSEKK